MEADNVCRLVVEQAPREFVADLLGLAVGETPEVEAIGEELPARPLSADTLLRLRAQGGSMMSASR